MFQFFAFAFRCFLKPPLFFLFARCGPRREKWALGFMSGIGFLWAAVQSRFYSTLQDMCLSLSLGIQLRAAFSTLGQAWDSVNAIDVCNWGEWASLNAHFLLPGIFFLLGFLFLLKKIFSKNQKVVSASLIPISGLIFDHRNFYSTRYSRRYFCFSEFFLESFIPSFFNVEVSSLPDRLLRHVRPFTQLLSGMVIWKLLKRP